MKFCNLLTIYRDKRGFKKIDLARKIGVTPQYIINLEKGYSDPPTVERLQQISLALGLSDTEKKKLFELAYEGRKKEVDIAFQEVIGEQKIQNKEKADQGLVKVPVLGIVPAGKVTDFVETEEYLYLDKKLVREKDVVALKIKGDCLVDKNIFDGDFVMMSRNQPVKEGNIAIVRIDDEITCKIVHLLEGNNLLLESANKDKPWRKVISPKEKNIEILGRVIGSYRNL